MQYYIFGDIDTRYYIFGGIFVFFILAIIFNIFAENKRTGFFQQFADDLGLEFFGKEQPNELQSLESFDLFGRGRSRRMYNIMMGETDIARIAIFDYKYTTNSGKNSSDITNTVVSMQSDTLQIPNFSMRPEHLLDAVGSALGLQDIDFDDHPQFSKMFVLQGTREEAVREFFDREVLDFFADQKGISLEARAGEFIFYRRKVKKSQLKSFMEQGYAAYSVFKSRLERA